MIFVFHSTLLPHRLSVLLLNEEQFLKAFGKNLKKLREAKKLSTREFAYTADISHSSVGRLENGLSNPSATTLLKLAEALGTDFNTLLILKSAK